MGTFIYLTVLLGLPIVGFLMGSWIGLIIGIFIAVNIPKMPGK